MTRPLRSRIHSPLLKELANAEEVHDNDYDLIDAFMLGSENAAHKLFIKHHKMILKIIIDITGGRWYDDDCLHAGAVGLYEAARRFDKNLGYTFLTYAVPWVRKYVHIEVCNDALPVGGLMFGRDFKERMFRFIGYKMTGKSNEDIADLMHISIEDAERLAVTALMTSRPVSLNSIQNAEDEEGADYELNGMPSEASAEDSFLDEELREAVQAIVEDFDDRSKFILNHTLALHDHGLLTRKQLMAHFEVYAPEYTKFKREAYKQLKMALLRKRVTV